MQFDKFLPDRELSILLLPFVTHENRRSRIIRLLVLNRSVLVNEPTAWQHCVRNCSSRKQTLFINKNYAPMTVKFILSWRYEEWNHESNDCKHIVCIFWLGCPPSNSRVLWHTRSHDVFSIIFYCTYKSNCRTHIKIFLSFGSPWSSVLSCWGSRPAIACV